MLSSFPLRTRRFAIAFCLAVVALLMIFLAFRPVQPVLAPGGSYRGVLPGYGAVQLDLFLGGSWDRVWLYREGIGLPERLPLLSKADGGMHAEFVTQTKGQWTTNAFLEFTLREEGQSLAGSIRFRTNSRPQSFHLSRATEFRAIHADSGFALSRRTTEKRFHGWFPLFKNSTPVLSAVNQRLAEECRGTASEFLEGSLRQTWDASRLGWPATMSGWYEIEHWQTRLVGDAICSFAVWRAPWTGGNGNSTRWSGRNYLWQDGQLKPFELEHLFDPQTPWQTELRRLCRDEILRQGALMNPDGAPFEKATIDTFTLSDTGLQIYFNPYVLASGAEGEFVAHIPYMNIQALLRKDGPAAALPTSRSR